AGGPRPDSQRGAVGIVDRLAAVRAELVSDIEEAGDKPGRALEAEVVLEEVKGTAGAEAGGADLYERVDGEQTVGPVGGALDVAAADETAGAGCDDVRVRRRRARKRFPGVLRAVQEIRQIIDARVKGVVGGSGVAGVL